MENKIDESKARDDIVEAQLHKINLEISSLEWQNSKIGRLAQFATVFTISATIVTILATLFGMWQGYSKFIADKRKDQDLKIKELTNSTNNQYRLDMQQLLQYPTDEKITGPTVLFNIQDLNNIIESEYSGTEQTIRRIQTGNLIKNIVTSSQFDLTKGRNLDFDKIALKNCDYYRDALRQRNPDDLDILYKYTLALQSFLKTNGPKEYQNFLQQLDNGTSNLPRLYTQNLPGIQDFSNLLTNYIEHVKLIKTSSSDNSLTAESSKQLLSGNLCSFYLITKSSNLTRIAFDIKDDPKSQIDIELTDYLKFCKDLK